MMLSPTVTTNINNSLSHNKQIACGSYSSMMSNIDFNISEKKTSSTVSYPNKCLNRVNDKSAAGSLFCATVKKNTVLDQNRNSQVKHSVLNGNKEKYVVEDGVPIPKIQLYMPGKVSLEWRQMRRIGSGLSNLGNTCFMNTVLQCLTYCPPLANYLFHDANHMSKCKITGFCMMCELQKHIKTALERPGEVIKPIVIYNKLRSIAKHFQGGRQEDAHEFLRYVIDNLWRSCLVNYDGYQKLDPASRETTIINHIFGGYHRSQVTCLHCKKKSNTYDHFMDLMLDVKNAISLEKALEKFIQPELLQSENAYKCPHCKIKVSAQKKFSVHRAPNVATFQFKRFDYNKYGGGKITKHITYPEHFDLRPYMSDNKGSPVIYRLNAVIVHLGPSCNTGHYFCYVKNSNGIWYLMDDSRVHQVPLNQVLNQIAYVLFYVRSKNSENSCVKKASETLTSNRKNNCIVKNSILAFSNNESPGTGVTRLCSSLKPSPLPNMPCVSSSTTTNLPNGTANNSNKKQLFPLSQNKSKVAFSLQQANSNLSKYLKGSSIELKSGNSKINPLTEHCTTNISNKLVPYRGDSSESSDEETSKIVSNFESRNDNVKRDSSFLQEGFSVTYNGIPKTFSTDLMDKGEKNVQNETTLVVKCHSDTKSKAPVALNLDKSMEGSTSNIFSVLNTKMKSTCMWNVKGKHLHSPSMASGSNTNCVNSTADWDVTERDSAVKKENKRNYSGWKIRSMDDVNEEPITQNFSPQNKADFQLNTNKGNKSFNSEIFPQKPSEGNYALSEISKGDSETLDNGESTTLKCSKPKHSEGLLQQRMGSVKKKNPNSHDIPHSSATKNYVTSESNNTKQQSGRKQTSNFRSQGENGLLHTKHSFREHMDGDEADKDERKGSTKRPRSKSPKDSSKKGGTRHSNSHEISNNSLHKRFKEGKIGSKKIKYDSKHCVISLLGSNKKMSSLKKEELGIQQCMSSEGKESALCGSLSLPFNKDSNEMVEGLGSKKNAVVSKIKDSESTHESNSPDLSTDSSSGSSCEYEWVEKTKESMEAGKVSSKVIPVKVWNSDKKNDFRRDQPKEQDCDFNKNADSKSNVVSELLKNSLYSYGAAVSSWNGNESYLDSISCKENQQKQLDEYDEELDKGKVRKIKQKACNTSYLDHNPFQKAQNMKNKLGTYNNEYRRIDRQPHKRHCSQNSRHRKNFHHGDHHRHGDKHQYNKR